jgi:hypothetical protein
MEREKEREKEAGKTKALKQKNISRCHRVGCQFMNV